MAPALGQSVRGQPGWFAQVENLVAVHRYALAEELTRHELTQNPRSGFALVVLSMVLNSQDRHPEAEAAARSAVAAQPSYAEAYYFLALSLGNQRRNKEAGEALATALGLDPGKPKFYALRSYLELAWGHPVQSRATAEAGLRWDPANLDCLYRQLQALRQLDENDLAEATARTILSLDPSHWRAHLALGQLLLPREAYAEAEGHFRTALQYHPDSQEARAGLSVSWKQRYWLPRQMERLDGYIVAYNEWFVARLGTAGHAVAMLGLTLAISMLCVPLLLLYGWAYLRWRLAPVVMQLRGRPLAWLGPLSWRLVAAGLGCVGAAVLAVLLPARLPVVAATLAGLAALGVWQGSWREVWGESEHRYAQWMWVGGAAAIVFIFWLDDAPLAIKSRLMLFAYTGFLSAAVFLRPPTAR
ncbi:tetratricopeptide repeat protein [Hymenobacter negativus]|uniref:Tetratricopeptide repeat protein n=1 Tax=Hymenobacter negativus TaxID=2795026 RepID=A0ABS0Q5I1_9BACT|nr:tetratricopeptide repeat protein [Hymenobacter negativus]MBH8557516.1 tetratricopeptide repeat protein [Hymenobacter negativus]